MEETFNLKHQLEQSLLAMLKPLKTRFSEEKAGLPLGGFAAGYGMKIAEMEGAMRLLWGLTPYWTGGGKEAEEWKDIYLNCVRHGTDPDHPAYWGDIHDRDQKIVEMAALSCNLMMTPDVIWNRMTSEEQDHLASWLYQANSAIVPDNNWHFFVVLANLALKKLKKPYSKERILQGIDRYESFYLDHGWYGDGNRPQKDYYISFGIHFYCLLYVYFMEKEDPERCEKYRSRAVEFLETFRYWFDDQGRALAYGRSMTYRFAQAAFLSACIVVLKDNCPRRGELKHLLRLHMEHWMAQPIFDNGGVLTVGYHYPNLLMSEGYNSPGSPYWAFKTFLPLILADDDSFWSEKEVEPVWEPIITIPECNMVITHEPGQAFALTAGQYPAVVQSHSAAKYSKFAYSTVFGFSVPRSTQRLYEVAPDNMLAFEAYGVWFVRKQCSQYQIADGKVTCTWSPLEGITVETRLIPTEHGYTGIHRINTAISCKINLGGFSYPVTAAMKTQEDSTSAKAGDSNGYSQISMELTCSRQPVETKGQVINAAPNVNLMYPLTKIPSVTASLKPGIYEIFSTVTGFMKPGKIITGKGDCYELE